MRPPAKSSGKRRPEPVVAAASTYMIDGKQYVSVAVGWGGLFGISQCVTELQSPGTVYTFAIDGKASPPAFEGFRVQRTVPRSGHA